MAYWDERDYIDIKGAAYDAARDLLHVHFANGDLVDVPAGNVVLPRYGADWSKVTVEDDGAHLHVPVAPGHGDLGSDTTDIPGFYIRSLTDAGFAAHLASRATESALRIGSRVRELRQARGLTAKEVAQRAGVAAQTITRLELGQHDVGLGTLQKILTVMGYTMAALVPSDRDVPAASRHG